ncbi:MAG TPA: HEAT repeat domain-containing protein [Longimicrobiales bacterium]
MKTTMLLTLALGTGVALPPARPLAAQDAPPPVPAVTPADAPAPARIATIRPALAPLRALGQLERLEWMIPARLTELESALAVAAASIRAAAPSLAAVEAARVDAAPGLAAARQGLVAARQGLAAAPALAAARASLAGAAQGLASLGHAPSVAADPAPAGPRPAWAAQDPADSLYRAAREALNRNDYTRAASLFAEIIRRHPDSVYTPDAYYWQAFALYRTGEADALRTAAELLQRQKARYPRAATITDADALATRIAGQLARLGDADAAASLAKAATDSEATCSAEEDDVRTAALNALLQMDADRAVPILKKVLARRDPCAAPLRRRAVFLVSQKVTPETADILLDLARNDPDREVREQAVFWLSQVDTDEAVAALQQVLATGDDPQIQEKALFALSQHSSAQAARILRDYAGRADAPAELREHAVFWIGQAGSAENARFLRDLYRRVDGQELKEKIIFSLSQMDGVGNERWLMEVALDTTVGVDLRKSALFWAGQAGAPIAELAALYDRMRGREMKEQLIFVYSQRDERAAVDKLIQIAREESDPELRKKAIFWLGQSDDPRAAEFLLEIITHD